MKMCIAVFAVSVGIGLLSSIQTGAADDRTQPLTQHDTLKIASQKICPVSGKQLGSMGTPLKRRIGKEDLFLCCIACAKGKVSREHWTTIHANFRKAQRTCPVMGKDLPAAAKSTIVDGQIVYVCCPPCTDKIQADPKKWLAKVDHLYATSIRTPGRDDLKIAAQKICPVSGRKLGSMGSPIKTKVGKEELFLCCKACATGKISRQHWGTIHANFAKAQGTCPVMEKKLPANPKWTVVDGQIVYVCCPPCIEKIEADQPKFLGKVAGYYTSNLTIGAGGTPQSTHR